MDQRPPHLGAWALQTAGRSKHGVLLECLRVLGSWALYLLYDLAP